MTTVNKAFWLSYDLGLKGDYAGMYKFLDALGAKECGDSFAYFRKNVDINGDYVEVIKEELLKNVNLSNTDRIYLIHQDDDNKIKGKFLNGGRKRAPWEGYALSGSLAEEDI